MYVYTKYSVEFHESQKYMPQTLKAIKWNLHHHQATGPIDPFPPNIPEVGLLIAEETGGEN